LFVFAPAMFCPTAPALPPCQPPVAMTLTTFHVAPSSLLEYRAIARSLRSPSLDGVQFGSAALCSLSGHGELPPMGEDDGAPGDGAPIRDEEKPCCDY
jgi:hypothetical protein